MFYISFINMTLNIGCCYARSPPASIAGKMLKTVPDSCNQWGHIQYHHILSEILRHLY